MSATQADSLGAGRAALARAAWDEARAAFEAAVAGERSAEALEGLSAAVWWLDDVPASLALREEAYRLYRERGDARGAARMAVMMAGDCLEYRGEPAIARGWYQRAEGLLAGLDPTPEHGWLAVGRGLLALMIDKDPTTARRLAAAARAVGAALGDTDLDMMARAGEGLALVFAGRVSEGMPLLDEAATAAMAGEMRDLIAVGNSCCMLITACELARDFDRAAQWCDKVMEFCRRCRITSLMAYCRVQHATVLLSRGAWEDAEAELHSAIAQLQKLRPGLQGDGIVRLADLRRRQGRFDEAEALLRDAQRNALGQFVSAALAYDRADPATAVDHCERYLRRLTPEDRIDRLRAADLLALSYVALGDSGRAQAALDELREYAQGVGTESVKASVAFAEGTVAAAAGEADSARRRFEDAVDLYARSGTPFELARARLELAQALTALGRRDAALKEATAARETFVQLGAAGDLERADALVGQIQPLRSVPRPTGPGGRLSKREIEVLRLVSAGLSNAEIAPRLSVSEFTVKRHVANILRKLDLPSRAAAAAFAAREQLI